MRVAETGVDYEIFQYAVGFLERPVQCRGKLCDSVHDSFVLPVVKFIEQGTVKNELFIDKGLIVEFPVTVINDIVAKLKNIVKLRIVCKTRDIQVIVIQSRRYILRRKVRHNIEKSKSEVRFTNGVLAVNNHLSDCFIGDTGCAEIIVADIREIKRYGILEILESAYFKSFEHNKILR